MSLDPDFYVDSATACFLACFGNTCENHEFEDALENRELCKYRMLQIRIILGIVFNIIGFIAVVVVNNETYKESNAALGFFILIVTFILIYYGGFLGLTCLLREVFQHFGDETETERTVEAEDQVPALEGQTQREEDQTQREEDQTQPQKKSQEVANQSLCANACNISTSFWSRHVMVQPTYAQLNIMIIGQLDSQPQEDEKIKISHKCKDTKSHKEIYEKLTSELDRVNEAAYSKVVISFGLDVRDNDT
ncbi:Hypothetical predicted protein [Mytilus galloprovincialis]|uniref:Transmembrane protein n=1 Tax=Mytilus galloprovincialis TaxID=29158 RepID=A0A8B6ES80_MYTGA|nr:Hypothetical predicted protein [Mytilus galloprovincialis]